MLDPPVDRALPAALEAIVVESGGAKLNGIVYVAPGPGPHPTVVLLHGFPGNERNLDLAQALRRAGWNVLFFHYRGTWGSGGEFSFGHVVEDAAAAVRTAASPGFAAAHRADPMRIALVGHSMGGFAALTAAAELAEVDCVVSLAGANLSLLAAGVARDPEFARVAASQFDAWSGPIRGPGGAALVREIVEAGPRFDLRQRAPALAEKPVLLVAGQRDVDTPPELHHWPLFEALSGAPAARLRVEFDADHAFSDHRVKLARVVAAWLDRSCR